MRPERKLVPVIVTLNGNTKSQEHRAARSAALPGSACSPEVALGDERTCPDRCVARAVVERGPEGQSSRYRSSRGSLGFFHSFSPLPPTTILFLHQHLQRLGKLSEPRALRYRISARTRRFAVRDPAIPIAAFHPPYVGRP